MSHVNKVFDSDPHFTISPITRQIVNDSSKKTTLIQYDHNSERFSFELDRIVEGHDMTECNLVEVQFINTGANSSEVTKDVYEVKDLQIKPDDDTKIVFTWLLSNNATMYEGKLAFAIRFACINADGSVDYAWHTATHENIKISKGMNNADDVVTKEMSDILAQWKAELFGASEEGVENIYTARDASLEAIAEAKNEAVAAFQIEGGTLFANAIKATASGEIIRADDVSPLEHTAKVKVHGKNKYYAHTTRDLSMNGVVISMEEKKSQFTIDGTATSEFSFNCGSDIVLPKGIYSISVLGLNANGVDRVYLTDVSEKTIFVNFVYPNAPKTIVIDNDVIIRVKCVIAANSVYENGSVLIQIENGKATTEYEPFIDPSTVTVTRCGKNLLASQTNHSETVEGVTFAFDEKGKCTINGTNKSANWINVYAKYASNGFSIPKGTTVTVSGVDSNDATCAIRIFTDTTIGNTIGGLQGDYYKSTTITLTEKTLIKEVLIRVAPNATISNVVVAPVVEIGSTSSGYEKALSAATYTPNADGTVDIASVSPTMTLLTDTAGVNIELEYNQDTNVAMDNVKADIAEADKMLAELSAEKADTATTLQGYGIKDAYTKTEVTSLISESIGEALESDY